MSKPVLVVMAAGMGSRFGGLKQITPMDREGDIMMDFSLFDAKRAGFETVVFIIKKAIAEAFMDRVGRRMEPHFDVRYAYQELDKLPAGFAVPEGRVKPWGTAHAVACAADVIDGPFAVINADDFYGRDAFRQIYSFLTSDAPASESAMVGYRLENTVTENGSVARGICQVDRGLLTEVVERTRIEIRPEGIAFTEDGETWTTMPGDTLVSMNLWGFHREMLDAFSGGFADFLRKGLAENPLKCEYYLPTVANQQIHAGTGTVRVLPTSSVWHGVTYREDMPGVQAALETLKEQGEYPRQLWS